MFQISNVEDDKSEWSVNETHILIPMIDGDIINKESDKILTNSLTLNSLETGDQAICNTLEHSFVIGLDKNIFETPLTGSDLVIIQNSDLKNSVACTLSYIDEDKNEVLWQSSLPNNTIYATDEVLLEVRDELDYEDSVHELEKNEQINIVNLDPQITIATQVSKTDNEILHQEIDEETSEKSQVINILTVAQDIEPVPNLQYVDSAKPSEKDKAVNTDKLIKPNILSNRVRKFNKPNILSRRVTIDKSVKPNILSKSAYEKNRSKTKESVNNNTQLTESNSINVVENSKHKTDQKMIILGNKSRNTKDRKVVRREVYNGVSDSLPEKSLPLKKKAKMKRTLTYIPENQNSLVKQDVSVINGQSDAKLLIGQKDKERLMKITLPKVLNQSQNSGTPVVKKVTKLTRAKRLTNPPKKCKSRKFIPNFLVLEMTSPKFIKEDPPKIDEFELEKNKFSSIYDLVDCMRKCRMISETVREILHSGLHEMNVDILKEMNAKKNRNGSSESTNYSSQLKAFALILNFKQPAAFNLLAQFYQAGWPSRKVIQDWKTQINNSPKFLSSRSEKIIENNLNLLKAL